MDGRMLNEWVLSCSGRVIGAKTPSAVDNLLRLHKKKCAICRNLEYLCIDEGIVPTRIKKLSELKTNRDDYNRRHLDLINRVDEMDRIV